MPILLALLVLVLLWYIFKPVWAPKPPDASPLKDRASQASIEGVARAREASKEGVARAREASKEVGARAREVSNEVGVRARQMYEGLRGRKPSTVPSVRKRTAGARDHRQSPRQRGKPRRVTRRPASDDRVKR